jgi:RNA polymerase sigma-70 factor (ECF subfamily)
MTSPVERNQGGAEPAEASFRRFFRAERDGLLQMCWAVTLDRELARDVAQETMARAWSSWGELSTDGSRPAAWCRTVALNLIRSHWRRLRTERSTRPPAVQPVELDAADMDLIRALHRLSDRQREAVVLHHLVDLPVHEVATAMGISASSVKEHLQRGRAQLERRLAPERVSTKEVGP